MNELALFNDLFNNFDEGEFALPSFNFKKAFQTPKVDIKQNDNAYTLEMDLPGKTDKDVNIELNNNILTISSSTENRKEEKSEKKADGKWIVRERSYSRFSRSFALPEDVNSEKLSACVKNGILTVTMPRKALASPKRIAITCA